MSASMNAWFTQNTDYLVFLVLVAGLSLGLGRWLHRTGRLASLPKITWLLLIGVAGGGWWAVNHAGRDAQGSIRRQVELLVPYYVQEMQQAGHARLPDNPPANDALYEKLIQLEINWLKLNPAIADVYTGCTDDPAAHGREARVDDAMHAMTSPRNEVLRFLPHKERRMAGAWRFVDLFGPSDVHDQAGMAVAPHPHMGRRCPSWRVMAGAPRPARGGVDPGQPRAAGQRLRRPNGQHGGAGSGRDPVGGR